MGAISGAHLKPAVSLALALRGDFPCKRVPGYWVYVAGPIAGALIAVGCAYVLRGPGGDPISKAVGPGVLRKGGLAEKQRLSGEIERGDVVPSGIADEADRWL